MSEPIEPMLIPDGDDGDDGPVPPKEPPPKDGFNPAFFRPDRPRRRFEHRDRHHRHDRHDRHERRGRDRFRDRSRSREMDLRKISNALCRMVRYEEHRPPGLDVDDDGRISLNQLLQITNFNEKAVLAAVKEHQYQDRSTGALRFSLEPSPETKDIVIRVYPGRGQQSNESNWSRYDKNDGMSDVKAEVKTETKEESWYGKRSHWWGRKWNGDSELWAEG